MKIVVLHECFFNKKHTSKLSKLGELVVYKDTSHKEVAERLRGADIAVIDQFITPFDKKILESVRQLKFVALNTTSFAYVDLESAKRLGIKVSNVPGFSKQAVAELAVGLMFSVNRKIALGDRLLRKESFELDPGNKNHNRFVGFEFKGKTLGIIGLGNIGAVIAQLGSALGMKVIAYNRSRKNIKGVSMTTLSELLKSSDIVAISVPLNDGTRNMISQKEIGLMKQNSILVSISPPEVVDSNALYTALKSGKIGGAGIDVYGAMKEDRRFASLDNVVLTPHCGSFTSEAFFENLPDMIVENIESFIKGKPKNLVNAP